MTPPDKSDSSADGAQQATETTFRRRSTAIFISGRGSNMMALVERAAAPDFPAEIALVLANRPDAAGLDWARALGIETATVDHQNFEDRPSFEAAINKVLEAHQIELVALAGFMRILTAPFVERWHGRMINIHPSLLPKYKGLDTHNRAIAAGETEAGCTVHFVVPEMDAGPTIVQAPVPILPGDNADTLAARVLAEEHRIYPLALGWVASQVVQLSADKTVATRPLEVPENVRTPVTHRLA